MADPLLTNEVETDPVLRLFIDSLTDQAVFTLDPRGVISTWNEGCRRLKGYAPEEAIGRHFGMLYTQEDQDSGHPQANLRRAEEQGVFHEERTRIRKGGQPFLAEVSIYPIESEGRLAGFAKIVRDVTERRRLEQERDEALLERVRLSNAEIQGFLHSIAHDLPIPIRSIVARGRMVREEFGESVPEELRGHLDAIVRSSLHLSRLVQDLLAYARLGQEELVRVDVDASAMVGRIVSEMRSGPAGERATVVVQQGVRARADRRMLEVLLRCLLDNAMKFTEGDPSVRFGQEEAAGELAYFVRDEGIGFDPEYTERAFEPFERLHGLEAFYGTGIGLAKVRRVAERHGGRAWAESEPARGATFYFTLP